MDGEAALLPPSELLHCALEAMLANASKGQARMVHHV